MYISINLQIEEKTSIVPLIAGLHKDTQVNIAEGVQMVWESYKLDQYVQKYAEQILVFQEKVEDLLVVEEQLDLDVKSLETCAYSASTLADILSKIQRAVDDLSLRQYSNLHIWVTRLDQQVMLVFNLLYLYSLITQSRITNLLYVLLKVT